jgi:hypothetical protein
MPTAHWPAPSRLPLMPSVVWSAGLCIRHRRPELWTSSLPADRERAAAICSWCPALSACRAWSLGLPWADNTVYGGLGSRERHQLRKAAQEPASSAAADEEIPPAA